MSVNAVEHAAVQASRRGRSAALIPSAIAVALNAAGIVLLVLNRSTERPDAFGFPGYQALFTFPAAAVAALILRRLPGHPIGLMFAANALISGLQALGLEYALYGALTRPGSLPFVAALAWVVSWSYLPFVLITAVLLPILFPDGHPLSRGWLAVAWVAVAATVVAIVGVSTAAGPMENAPFMDNPLGIHPGITSAIRPIGELSLPIVGLCAAASAVSLVQRFRRARGDERQQLKWLASSAALVGAILPFTIASSAKIVEVAAIVALSSIPVAAGIAILRYRLYEIDLIIRRTVFYGALTAILAGVVAASIALFQRFFIAITGEQSDAANVLSTVVLVSAFTPIKNALQEFVDRRFKERPDAAARLAPFVGQIRAYLELQRPREFASRVLDELVAAVDATGGAIHLNEAGRGVLVHRVGDDAVPALTLPFGTFGSPTLGPRRGGQAYTEGDRAALHDALDVAAQTVALTERSHVR